MVYPSTCMLQVPVTAQTTGRRHPRVCYRYLSPHKQLDVAIHVYATGTCHRTNNWTSPSTCMLQVPVTAQTTGPVRRSRHHSPSKVNSHTTCLSLSQLEGYQCTCLLLLLQLKRTHLGTSPSCVTPEAQKDRSLGCRLQSRSQRLGATPGRALCSPIHTVPLGTEQSQSVCVVHSYTLRKNKHANEQTNKQANKNPNKKQQPTTTTTKINKQTTTATTTKN